jgi:hypothetical protein
MGYKGPIQFITSTRHASTSLEVRLENHIQTYFHMKQAARSRCVSPPLLFHRFCGATDKP